MAESEVVDRSVDELVLDALLLRICAHAREAERVEDIGVLVLGVIVVDFVSRRNNCRATRKYSAVAQCYIFQYLPREGG